MALTLHAGIARADITPPIGIAHANWGAQTHERAAGIDLPLELTALALGDGTSTSVIIDIACCWLWGNTGAEVLASVLELTGLPEHAVRLSYTHTHSGPAGGSNQSWVTGGVEMVDSYIANLGRIAAGATWAAIRDMEPVRIAGTTGESSISVNRRFQRPEDGAVVVGRNWDGIVNRQVNVLRLDRLDGSPFAAVVHFGCHPITVGPDNDKITPDYPGVVKRVVEANVGAPTVFLQGAAGDIGPVRGVASDGANQYKRLGTILGLEAAKLWLEADPVPTCERYVGTLESGAPLAQYEDTPLPDRAAPVRVAKTIVQLPMKEPGDEAALKAELDTHNQNLAALRESGASADEIRQVTMKAKRASMRHILAQQINQQEAWPVEIYATAIGDDIALLGMSVEPFAAIGLAIQGGSPFKQTLVSGYSGLSFAYLPTADAYPLGGYEIEVTPFAPEAADIAIAAAVDLLRQLKEQA
ncbi:MAG TPA: neutral/alkaline non-lysosomal ceramidase N-terminal domain-containing protein [Thermomicrobiales bacterium]|nr:neutral/alkaline non-lysosomal ceramidase N-terminal domain-containing protein [Thermomicrobiales bacterium]